ncbi:MAG: ribosomal-processing cysteine protease Prp [Eubacterium ramulus]
MVKITVYQNHDQQFVGFDCLGHAEYSDENDIVCAAVSAMTINCNTIPLKHSQKHCFIVIPMRQTE